MHQTSNIVNPQHKWGPKFTTYQDRYIRYWSNYIQNNAINYQQLATNKKNCDKALTLLAKNKKRTFAKILFSYCRFLRENGHVIENLSLLERIQIDQDQMGDQQVRAKFHYNLGEIFALTGNRLAHENFEQAQVLAQSLSLPSLELAALSGLGRTHLMLDREEQAISTLKKAVRLGQKSKDHPEYFTAARNLSNTLVLHGKAHEAQNLLLNLLKQVSIDQPSKELAIVYDSLGILHCNMGQVLKGTDYLLHSLQVEKKLGTIARLANCYSSLSISYSYLLDFQKAIRFRELALKVDRQRGNTSAMPSHFTNYALLLCDMKRFDEAYEKVNLALKFASKLTLANKIVSILRVKSSILIDLNRFDEAEKILNENFEQVESGQNYSLKILYVLQYGRIFTKQRAFEKANAQFRIANNYATASKLNFFLPFIFLHWGLNHIAAGDMRKAKLAFEETIRMGKLVNSQEYIATGSFELAKIALAEGNQRLANTESEKAFNAIQDKQEAPIWKEITEWRRTNHFVK